MGEEGRLGDDPELSRRHARLARDASEGADVEDLGSANGTFVNGQQIGERQSLAVATRYGSGAPRSRSSGRGNPPGRPVPRPPPPRPCRRRRSSSRPRPCLRRPRPPRPIRRRPRGPRSHRPRSPRLPRLSPRPRLRSGPARPTRRPPAAAAAAATAAASSRPARCAPVGHRRQEVQGRRPQQERARRPRADRPGGLPGGHHRRPGLATGRPAASARPASCGS